MRICVLPSSVFQLILSISLLATLPGGAASKAISTEPTVNGKPPTLTRLVKRAPMPDDPASVSTQPMPATTNPAAIVRAVPKCYGDGKSLKEGFNPVKCSSDDECQGIFLNEKNKERGATKVTCQKDAGKEVGACQLECRTGWKEYDAVKGHCSASTGGIAFYDYCCGGSIATDEGCQCKEGVGLDDKGNCQP